MTEPAKTHAAAEFVSWKDFLYHPAFICFVLALATLAVFGRVGRYEFVNYDDPDYVTANLHVQGGLKLDNVIWALQTGHASNWHPLTWLTHILDWQMFGDWPGGHHLTNVCFHIANTLLVFLLLRRMTGVLWQSAVVAALFGLHPMHVESVAWVSERKDVVSGLFFLLTLWAYARFAEASGKYSVFSIQNSDKRPSNELPIATRRPMILPRPFLAAPKSDEGGRRGEGRCEGAGCWYGLALAFFVLGLMSKPMLVTVPFLLLLLDYWPLERFQLKTQNSKLKTFLSLLLEKVPFLALSVASSVITFRVQRAGGAVSTSLPLAGRIANALVSYARYVGKLVWPQNLSVLYPHPGHWGADALIGSTLFFVAAFAAVSLLSRGRPYLTVGWLWFVGMLVPAIGLVQVGIQSMADRYSYLPSIGFFVMLVWGLGEFLGRAPVRKVALTAGATLALVVCALLSIRQTQYWRNSEVLFRRAAKVTEKNYLAYNNLGFYLSGKGKTDEAMENYQRALEINPDYEDALNNMGFALAARKKYSEAIGYYELALQIRPKHAEVHNNLGNALAETGKVEDAIKHYRIVLEQKPDHADAHNNLGIALAMQGKLDEAMEHFHAAIRFKPTDASAHSNLGNGLAAQHKLDEAIKEYQESLRLKPDDAQAHNNLGNALAEQGKLDNAVKHYQEALRLNADNPETEFNLGMALARQGKLDDAVTHYATALRLKPDYAAARNELNRLRPSVVP